MILGITGTDGAGKGTVVDYLVKKKGFKHYHARSLFLEEIKRQALPVDRAHMRLVANELRKKHGNDHVVRFFIERARERGDECIVIDSLRTAAEAEYLKTHGGILIAVDADQKLRYERVQKRRSESDQVTFEQFKEHEKLEMNDPDPHGMQKARVIEMADYLLTNGNSIEELHSEVGRILEKIAAA